MAKQYRKLQKKLQPPAEKPAPRRNYGKDYFLIGVIAFTALILIAAWQTLEPANLVMYSLLLTSLCITYARRHVKMSAKMDYYLERAGLIFTIAAVSLFVVVFYRQFIA